MTIFQFGNVALLSTYLISQFLLGKAHALAEVYDVFGNDLRIQHVCHPFMRQDSVRDRRGYSTEIDCTVVKSQRSSALRYWDRTTGTVKRIPVRTLDGVVHYYTIEDKDSE